VNSICPFFFPPPPSLDLQLNRPLQLQPLSLPVHPHYTPNRPPCYLCPSSLYPPRCPPPRFLKPPPPYHSHPSSTPFFPLTLPLTHLSPPIVASYPVLSLHHLSSVSPFPALCHPSSSTLPPFSPTHISIFHINYCCVPPHRLSSPRTPQTPRILFPTFLTLHSSFHRIPSSLQPSSPTPPPHPPHSHPPTIYNFLPSIALLLLNTLNTLSSQSLSFPLSYNFFPDIAFFLIFPLSLSLTPPPLLDCGNREMIDGTGTFRALFFFFPPFLLSHSPLAFSVVGWADK